MSKLTKLSGASLAFGGFLIFVGVIMVAISVLVFYDALKVPVDSKQANLFMWFLLVISSLNLAQTCLVYLYIGARLFINGVVQLQGLAPLIP